MPQDKDLKRFVRQRMAETGERYTTARAAIKPDEGITSLTSEMRAWVNLLGEVEHAENAFSLLKQLPTDQRRMATAEGLLHSDWRVRRRCAQLLDDLVLTDETTSLLMKTLDDPYSRVRRAALHSLTCEHCKPEACDIDVRAIARKGLADPNADVRAQALWTLGFWPDRIEVSELRLFADKDPSAKVRKAAKELIGLNEGRATGNAARLAQPVELQAKMEKHAGKWVAVAEGRIVSVDQHRGQIRRDLRGTGHLDAVICWVPPKETQEGLLNT
ncbi:MAG: HEAT repeat domain-containing protein [Actinobacteria bacterium]|nr:HEAT repeat domain-containing protein [Actinomycetota bacterium]